MPTKKTAPKKGQDTVTAPEPKAAITNEEADAQGLFHGAPAAAFDHDNDGHPGGSVARQRAEDDGPDYGLPQPLVGDNVQFYANKDDGPYAAIITGINGDTIHLTIFKPGGQAVPAPDVPYHQDRTTDGPSWRPIWEAEH